MKTLRAALAVLVLAIACAVVALVVPALWWLVLLGIVFGVIAVGLDAWLRDGGFEGREHRSLWEREHDATMRRLTGERDLGQWDQ